MATTEEIKLILDLFEQLQPGDFIKKMNETGAGIGAVLRYLHEAEGLVTAGRISDFMGVSTARVAVLLKKMEGKGLIVKAEDAKDKRITVVKLSEYGNETVMKMRENLFMDVGRMIDTLGMERMREFFLIADEMRKIISKPDIEL